ncbi:hypothetical protein HIM_11891 [Hirsutella minnesotensis 3608]|uniref:Uncharacterized protein n=1 Tax=Hirsutella minnesotensis 3608 TaxID=1043627 RepID=A0A0F7ZQZ3_9HYPO|nr:hypothetical protein HIM_11891 [Hirsutella minnesotensis 3608]
MKSSSVFVAAAAAAGRVAASGASDVTEMKCAKANANYCVAGDIILRCNDKAIGTPGRCSANLSGYPPSGGVAECWESAKGAGDAACQKNCVVYAESPFTLPSDQCTPSYKPTVGARSDVMSILPIDLGSATPSPYVPPSTSGVSSSEAFFTIPEGTGRLPVSTPVSESGIMTIPEGTGINSETPPLPSHTSGSGSGSSSLASSTITSASTPAGSPSTTAASTTAGSPSGSPSSPASTSPPATAGAATNHAAGVLAAVGLLVAYLI